MPELKGKLDGYPRTEPARPLPLRVMERQGKSPRPVGAIDWWHNSSLESSVDNAAILLP